MEQYKGANDGTDDELPRFNVGDRLIQTLFCLLVIAYSAGESAFQWFISGLFGTGVLVAIFWLSMPEKDN